MAVEYPIEIAPTVLDVAALLRARTKDSNGVEVGTFNDDTRPTSSQVLTLIDKAVADVQAWLGPTPPPELAEAAKVAAALETACLIELSYYPEQVRSARSGYEDYKQLLDDKIAQLQSAARGLQPGGSTVSSTRIDVPYVDYVPPLPVPVDVAVAAEAT